MAILATRPPRPAETVATSRPTPPDLRAQASRRRARLALVVLLLMLLVAQPLTIPLAYFAIGSFIGVVPAFRGMDVHAQWQAYRSRASAPDVLFIGDSQTFTDIDVDAVSSGLSSLLHRRISVAKFGVPGEGPAFLDGLMYRIAHRPSRPKLIVFELQQYTFNADRRWDPTVDLWELSDPPDPGFMATAFRLDPGRWRLLRAWLVPYFMTYQPISQLTECTLLGTAQALATAMRHVPLELRHQLACQSGQAYLQVNGYQDDPHYRISSVDAGYVREAVTMARQAGSEVIFGQYPFIELQRIDPPAFRTFQAEADSLSATLGVPMFNLVTTLTDERSIHDSSIWLDLAHMEPGGARALAPTVSEVVAPYLATHTTGVSTP